MSSERSIPLRRACFCSKAGRASLNTYPEVLSAKAARQLQKLGVEVRVGAPVSDVDAGGVTVNDGIRIDARTVLWAAGVQATALAQSLPGPRDRSGRLLVTPTLQLADADSIFVIGDLASITQDGKPVPGVAYAAKQMGTYVAHAISRRVRRTASAHKMSLRFVIAIGERSQRSGVKRQSLCFPVGFTYRV